MTAFPPMMANPTPPANIQALTVSELTGQPETSCDPVEPMLPIPMDAAWEDWRVFADR